MVRSFGKHEVCSEDTLGALLFVWLNSHALAYQVIEPHPLLTRGILYMQASLRCGQQTAVGQAPLGAESRA